MDGLTQAQAHTMSSTTGDNPQQQNNTAVNAWAQFSQLPEYQLALLIWKVWPPFILLLGFFGNIATIFVMARIKDQNSSQHVILISLAACDFCIICASTLREWLLFVFNMKVYNIPIVPCKIHALLVYATRTLSAWLLTCVTVQRAVAVRWPHKIRVVCTVRRTWIIVASLVFAACVFHSDKLVGMEITSGDMCAYILEGYKLMEDILHWMDLCLSSLFPSVCLLVCDIILSVTLFKASNMTLVAGKTGSNPDGNKGRKKMASRTTVMILVLSCTFLILTLPLCLLILWHDFVQIAPLSRAYARLQLGRSVAMNLWYTNSAINFLLYCFTGTKFRREFLRWIRCNAKGGTSG